MFLKEISESPNINGHVYKFNNENKLVNVKTGNGFIFTSQTDYEKLCDFVTKKVYNLLCSPPYSLQCILLNGENVTNEPTANLPIDQSFVFVSKNFDTSDKLVVIIHGTGLVRAGQWSRKLIINESLDSGSQLPYIKRCLDNDWGVLVLNTNDNFYLDKNGLKKCIF